MTLRLLLALALVVALALAQPAPDSVQHFDDNWTLYSRTDPITDVTIQHLAHPLVGDGIGTTVLVFRCESDVFFASVITSDYLGSSDRVDVAYRVGDRDPVYETWSAFAWSSADTALANFTFDAVDFALDVALTERFAFRVMRDDGSALTYTLDDPGNLSVALLALSCW